MRGQGIRACPRGGIRLVVSRWGGANSDNFKGARPVERDFLLENFVIDALAHSLAYSGSGVVHPYPAASHIFGASKERVRESRVSPVYTSDCEGALLSHELVGALLPFSGKAAIGEMVAVEALIGSAVGAVENGEREAW